MSHIKLSKTFIILTFLLAFISNSFGQEDKDIKRPAKSKKDILDRFFLGGNIGLSFGSYTYFSFSPIIGYQINERISVGTHLRYDYVNDKRYSPPNKYSNYGVSILSDFKIIKQLFLHAEYELLNLKYYSNIYNDYTRAWVPHFYVGGGYSQQLGSKNWVNINFLYDLIQDSRSPYRAGTPIYQVNFNFGL